MDGPDMVVIVQSRKSGAKWTHEYQHDTRLTQDSEDLWKVVEGSGGCRTHSPTCSNTGHVRMIEATET
jgi:hypothetical protein